MGKCSIRISYATGDSFNDYDASDTIELEGHDSMRELATKWGTDDDQSYLDESLTNPILN